MFCNRESLALRVALCFLIVAFCAFLSSPLYAAPAKSPIKAPTKVAVKKQAPVDKNTPQVKDEAPAEAEPDFADEQTNTPAPPQIPDLMQTMKQNIIYLVAGFLIFIFLIVIIFKALSGRGKSRCLQCGKKIMSGQEFCESCASTRDVILDMEDNADIMAPVRTQQQVSTPQSQKSKEVKKKPRPTGRVIATITVRKGSNLGYKYSIYESQVQVSIGKDPECDVVLEDEAVDKHAVISVADGNVFTIYPISAAVDILVNKEKIKQCNLKSGDVIAVGETELIFARL